MYIKILGTSGTFPTTERNHISIYMNYQGIGILLDCGENTQRQMRIANISPTKINYILISHWHGDHILGLAGLLFNLANSNYQKELNIVLPEGYGKKIQEIIDVFDIPVDFRINVIESNGGKVVENEHIEIYSFPLRHTIKTLGYYIKEKDKIKLDREKIKNIKNVKLLKKLKRGEKVIIDGKEYTYKDFGYIKKGLKISYITDTIYFEDLINFIKESDLLLLESTFFNNRELAKQHYHLDYTEALELFEKSNSRILLLLHYSQRYKNEEIIKFRQSEKNIYTLLDFDEITYMKNIITIKNNGLIFRYKRDEKTGIIEKL